MPGGGVGGQNLGHLQNVLFTYVNVSSLSSYLIRQKKINVLFPETSKYFYGSVGRQRFFLEIIFLYRKSMKIIQN